MSSLYLKQVFIPEPDPTIYLMPDSLQRLPQFNKSVTPSVNSQTLLDGIINSANVHLPREIIVEILSWLPIKYIFQFRCVSKTWLQLLFLDSHFAKLHFERSIQSPSLLTSSSNKKHLFLAIDYTDCDKAGHLDLPFPSEDGDDNRYSVSGICNGLVCICNHKDDARVYVWNPLTKYYITISCSPTPTVRFPGYGYYKYTVFGFGFDHCSGKYKVMRVFCEFEIDRNMVHAQVSVYTLGVDSSWRTIYDDSEYRVSSICNTFTLVNGVLHWRSRGPSSFFYYVIVGFDLKEEVFREITPPSEINFDVSCFQEIGELSGFLCMFTSDNRETELEIWMMIEYDVSDSWTKVLIIEGPEVPIPIYFKPLGITLDGNFILQLNSEDLLVCDPKTKRFEKLKDFLFTTSLTYTYVGSLISPSFISKGGHSSMEDKI